MDQIRHVVSELKSRGLKAVILSGGGDPTVYKGINELISYLKSEGMEIGMITNGLVLERKLTQESIDSLTWIRISINTLDYKPDFKLPKIDPKRTTLGFSYIWNPLTTDETLQRIQAKLDALMEGEATYVRMLPDCNLPTQELEKAHEKLHAVAESLGAPFFHQYKTHETPPECHLGRVHPVLYTDGNIYPCDSLVLNSPEDDKKFHDDFALCRWDEVGEFYDRPNEGSLVDTKNCPKCVFAKQNDLLRKIIDGGVKPLSPEESKALVHKNFI
jgi:MoaA/NifB/PqqE/SkfB family radical SAM enzyme